MTFLAKLQYLSVLPILFVACTPTMKSSSSSSSTSSFKYEGYGLNSVPAELIAQFAPPALPAEVTRQIETFLDVRSPGRGLITNSGKTVYFTWSVTGRHHVWKWEQRTGFPVQMTGGEDRTFLQGLLPNERFLIVGRDQNGEENPGLYLQNVDGGPLTKIFHKSGVQAYFLAATDDSEFIFFSANDVKPASRTIYRFQMSNGKIDKIFDREGTWSIADLKDSETLLLVKWLGNTQNEFYEFNIRSKELKPILGQGKSEELAMAYGANENEFIVLTNMFGNFRRLYTLRSGAFNPITDETDYDIVGFEMDRRKNRLAIQSNQNGFQRIEVRDPKTFKPITFPKIEADHVAIGNFSWDGQLMTVSIEKATEPAFTAIYDFSKKELRPVLLASAPELDTDSFAQATLEYYPARDGTKIPMWVRRPLACKEPCPVIVHFHGGPESHAEPGFSSFAQIFVDAGFIYVEPNVRGSDGYGKEWLHADNGSKRLEVIGDIEDAAKYIRDNWKKDGKAPKIGVMGYSYGGYSTLYAMTKFAGAYDAGVALVGMSNLVTFLENTAPYRRHLRISEYGDPVKDRDALIELSPVTYLSQVKDPLLIIQGATDPRVPAGEAIQMYEKLKARNVDVGLILFSNEGHGSRVRGNQVLEIGHTIQFFQKHLLK